MPIDKSDYPDNWDEISRHIRFTRAAGRCEGSPAYPKCRAAHGALLQTANGTEPFDAVVLACHSDQALRLLGSDATPQERSVLGAIRYQPNQAVLHTDASVLPRRQAAWAAWKSPFLLRTQPMFSSTSTLSGLSDRTARYSERASSNISIPLNESARYCLTLTLSGSSARNSWASPAAVRADRHGGEAGS